MGEHVIFLLLGCQVLCGVCGFYPLLMVGSGSGSWLEACLPCWAGKCSLSRGVVLSGGRDPAVPKAVRGGGAVAGSGSPPAGRQWVPPRTCLPDSSGYHSRWLSRRHAPRRRCAPRRRGLFFGSSIGLLVAVGRLPLAPLQKCRRGAQVPAPNTPQADSPRPTLSPFGFRHPRLL